MLPERREGCRCKGKTPKTFNYLVSDTHNDTFEVELRHGGERLCCIRAEKNVTNRKNVKEGSMKRQTMNKKDFQKILK